jgi:hypothetical protein
VRRLGVSVSLRSRGCGDGLLRAPAAPSVLGSPGTGRNGRPLSAVAFAVDGRDGAAPPGTGGGGGSLSRAAPLSPRDRGGPRGPRAVSRRQASRHPGACWRWEPRVSPQVSGGRTASCVPGTASGTARATGALSETPACPRSDRRVWGGPGGCGIARQVVRRLLGLGTSVQTDGMEPAQGLNLHPFFFWSRGVW